MNLSQMIRIANSLHLHIDTWHILQMKIPNKINRFKELLITDAGWLFLDATTFSNGFKFVKYFPMLSP